MCVGIPMRVVEPRGLTALCDGRGELQLIDCALVGAVREGDWLMVFLGAARERMSEEAARQSLDALTALEMVLAGHTDGFDHLFADLIGREPTLPDHLLAQNGPDHLLAQDGADHLPAQRAPALPETRP